MMAATKFDNARMIRLAMEGKSREEIAAAIGCSPSRVTQVVSAARRAGEPIPSLRGRAPVQKTPPKVKPTRAPSSPTQTAAMYWPIEGVAEEDAARVRRDLEKRGPEYSDILAMLGLGAVAS